ncbi:MAG TPA: FAD-dependent thymidylate synthase [Chitinivibrionales bacterium]|jgi:thymidylate synthase (FAD)|nr:FAD-dependent thymidylate synthase [Chitinivibrionales bacterium]
MSHCTSPAAEKILDKKFKVLDKGFVRLVDYLGNDSRIVQAARVSFGKGTKTFREDTGLINYLLRNDHTSPFEQVVFTFHVKLPIFVARQWIRHRTARLNEISGRYSVMKSEFYLPSTGGIAFQSENNKQGRSSEAVPAAMQKTVLSILTKYQKELYGAYEDLLDNNIARELARINLPLSLYTEWYWQIDLHNLFRFLSLRLDAHAQLEIREYAKVLHRICAMVCPVALEAFDEHVLYGVRFSRSEMTAVRNLIKGKSAALEGKAYERFMEKLT